MIQTKEVEIRGRKYRRTWSDAGVYITRSGVKFIFALDPIERTDRVYTETDKKIPEMRHGKKREDADKTSPKTDEKVMAAAPALKTEVTTEPKKRGRKTKKAVEKTAE